MKRFLPFAALLIFALASCGEKPAPPPPAPPAKVVEAPPAKAVEAPPVKPAEEAPAPPPAVPEVAKAPAPPGPKSQPQAVAPLQEGIHYVLLGAPQPTDSGKKVEVLEFFWYACPHCYALQPSLENWLKRKPADVELRRVPAVLDNSWLQLARTYYALDAMGLVGKLHRPLFDAIHQQKALDPRKLARDPQQLFDWVAANGVDRQKFMDTYNSFAVTNRTQRASDLTRNYDVPHTPVLVVDGRYLISPSMKGNAGANGHTDYEKFFANLDQLIAMARKEPRAGKK